MKKYIAGTMVIVFLTGLTAKAQEGTAKNNELGISIDNIFVKEPLVIYSSSSIRTSSSSVLSPAPSVGLSYKANVSSNALRMKLMFQYASESYKISDYITQDLYSTFGIGYNLGFEHHVNVDKAQFFFGADLCIRYIKTKSLDDSPNYLPAAMRTTEFLGYGIAPLIGVKYFVLPALSVSSEMKFLVEHFQLDGSTKYTGTTCQFGPIGQLSLNFHF